MTTIANKQVAWFPFRTVVATEGTLPTADTQKTESNPGSDGTVFFALTDYAGALAIRFKGTAAADKTLGWSLWARKNLSDPLEYVAHGTATTGLTKTGETNEFYADTIVITDQQWYKVVKVVNGAPDTVINGGGIAKLAVDSCEYQVWEIVIRDIAGGGAECATAGADMMHFQL